MFQKQSNMKVIMLIGVLFCVLVSQINCEAKQQKARRGITEWRFKRMNDQHLGTNSNTVKMNEYEFYLSLLPKEIHENDAVKPLVFRLDLVSDENENYHYVPSE